MFVRAKKDEAAANMMGCQAQVGSTALSAQWYVEKLSVLCRQLASDASTGRSEGRRSRALNASIHRRLPYLLSCLASRTRNHAHW